MIQFHALNPFRPVNWRWERARLMREKKIRISRDPDDRWIQAAYKFQAKLSKCKDDVDRWELMERYPAIYAAYLIFSRGGGEERHPLRYAVEARLLAKQTPEQIGTMAGVDPTVIALYERVFFNVNEKLINPDYVMTCVLGPSVHAGLSDRDYDLLWKLFGYLYGPAVLDSFIHSTTTRYQPETGDEVDVCLADDARHALRRKVAVVARTFVINPFSQSELLNIYARFLEIEKSSDSGKAQDVILQNIQVMLDKLPWQAGEGVTVDQPALPHYDVGSAELRTEELLAMAMGQSVAGKNEIEQLTFPEPKDGR
jgi:hypothetical protein